MKLKTLKDFEGKYDAIESFINSKYLKQEAINWIKKLLNRSNSILNIIKITKEGDVSFEDYPMGIITGKPDYETYFENQFLKGAITTLVTFFNIEEGDLK